MNLKSVVIYLLCAQFATCELEAVQEINRNHPNNLFKMVFANKDQIYRVKNLKDINIHILGIRRIAYVESTKSWIFGDLFASQLMESSYDGSTAQAKRDLADVLGFENNNRDDSEDDEKVNDSEAEVSAMNLKWTKKIFSYFKVGNYFKKAKDQVYYEYSNSNITETLIRSTTFVPFGKCHKNDASMKNSLLLGYSFSSGVGGAHGVTLNTAFGPAFLYKTNKSFDYEVSGAITCDIPPRSMMQVQVLFDTIRVSGVRSRKLRPRLALNLQLMKLKTSEWKDEDDTESVSRTNFVIACVTDPNLLQC